MDMHTSDAKNAQLKNSREIAAMLRNLPREERLRVEGIIIGIGMRYGGAGGNGTSSSVRGSGSSA